MPGDQVEKTYAERQKYLIELRRLMKEDDLLRNLQSDDGYLQRFLYCTDFDVEEALKRLKTFYELLEECPGWFTRGSPEDKRSIIEKDIRIVPNEYDKEGRIIYIAKIGNMEYGTMDLVEDVVSVDDFFAEALSEDLSLFKNGVCILIDVANFSWKLMKWLNPFSIKMILKRATTMPIKDYRFHVINNNFLVKAAINFIWPFLPKYIKDRVYFHFNDYDSLYQHVDKESLPVEYGGKKDTDYSKYHCILYERSSQIVESFEVNRTRFLENLAKNKVEKTT
nr:alpha-tocopherol transfer protein-like [Leptinotarsa decemlineata]